MSTSQLLRDIQLKTLTTTAKINHNINIIYLALLMSLLTNADNLVLKDVQDVHKTV